MPRCAVQASLFFKPTAPVPVASKIWFKGGNDHEVECSWLDIQIAAGARVGLARCVRLHRAHGYPAIAHITTARVRTIAPITTAMSSAVLFCDLNGLNPMRRFVVE